MKGGRWALAAALLFWQVGSAQALILTTAPDGSPIYEFTGARSLSIRGGGSGIDLTALDSIAAAADGIFVRGRIALVDDGSGDALMGSVRWHADGDLPSALDIRSDGFIRLAGGISGFTLVTIAGGTIDLDGATIDTGGGGSGHSPIPAPITVAPGGSIRIGHDPTRSPEIPEPGTVLLAAAGLSLLSLRRRQP